MKPLILIIESDNTLYKKLSSQLDQFKLLRTESVPDALTLYEKQYLSIRAVLMNMDTAVTENLESIQLFKNIHPVAEVVLYAHKKSLSEAVIAMQAGAYDFFVLPITKEKVVKIVSSAIENTTFQVKNVRNEDLRYFETIFKEVYTGYTDLPKALNQSEGKMVSVDSLMDWSKKQLENVEDVHWWKSDDLFRNATVLVVEDEIHYADILEQFLSETYHVRKAHNAKDALRLLEIHHDIDLVLLDVFLPDINGVTLVKNLKDRWPDLEVIMLTAFELMEKAVEVLRYGARDFLTKPILKEDLDRVIKAALKANVKEKVFPAFQQKFVQKMMSEDEKINWLSKLIKQRKSSEEHVFMKDVYSLFPGLRQSGMPEELKIPLKVIERKGMKAFIAELRDKVSSFGKFTPIPFF